jgi:hypothetical protein
MTDITAAAVAARENARTTTGQFGAQEHSAPEATLGQDAGISDADLRRGALEVIDRILADRPKLRRRAHEFIEPKISFTWRPYLAYVEYDDQLQPEQLDAYLRGDDETLDEIDDRFREGDGYENALNDYTEDLIGKRLDDLDPDTAEQIREWIQDYDRSEVIPELVRHNRDVLVQLPAVDDDDEFGQALSEASVETDTATKAELLEKPFRDALTRAGIEMNAHNVDAIGSLIVENSLDIEYQAAEQWQLKLVTYTDPKELALSGYSEHGNLPRDVTVRDPYLLLVDRWNGRSHDVKLQGDYTTFLTEDRPARLDAVLGYGSLDKIAGVAHRAFTAHVDVKVAQPTTTGD